MEGHAIPQRPLNVCICGGGNAAHVLAADLGARPQQCKVSVFMSFQDEAERFRQGLAKANNTITRVLHGERTVGTVDPGRVSNRAQDTVPGSDIVLIAVPSFAHASIFRDIRSHLPKGCIVVVMPGQGGFQWIAQKEFGATDFPKIVLAGTSHLPYNCRISTYGNEVQLIGHKREIGVACMPVDQAPKVARMLTELIAIANVVPMSSLLEVTLYPSNQAMHPPIMYGLFHDYQKGTVFKEKPFFYEAVTPIIAEYLGALDNDIQAVAQKLGLALGIDLTHVPQIDVCCRKIYGADIVDDTSIQTICRTNRAYSGLTAPCKAVEDGFVPDFDSRYMTEDVPNGLCVIKGLALLCDCKVPMVDKLIVWAQGVMYDGKKCYLEQNGNGTWVPGPHFFTDTHAPQALLGVTTVEGLAALSYPSGITCVRNQH